MKRIRSTSLVLGGVFLLSTASASLATVTIKGMKTAMVDCYADSDLKKANGVIVAKEWPKGNLIADQEVDDAVHIVVGGKACWFDRTELEIDAPDVSGCEDQSGGFASRGLGDKKECKQKKSGR